MTPFDEFEFFTGTRYGDLMKNLFINIYLFLMSGCPAAASPVMKKCKVRILYIKLNQESYTNGI